MCLIFFVKGAGDHRDLPVLTHSCPTRRSSDLARHGGRNEVGNRDATGPGGLYRGRGDRRRPAGGASVSIPVFIDGAAGTTGLEIRERLTGRDDLSLIEIDAARRKDPAARAEALNAADFVILCLPDDAEREAVDRKSTRLNSSH